MAKKLDAEERTNTWNETADRYPIDQRLRQFGFKIRCRPKKGPVLWTSEDGHVLTEGQAVKQVQEKIKSVKK